LPVGAIEHLWRGFFVGAVVTCWPIVLVYGYFSYGITFDRTPAPSFSLELTIAVLAAGFVTSLVFGVGLFLVRATLGIRSGLPAWRARWAGGAYMIAAIVALTRRDPEPYFVYLAVVPLVLPVFVVRLDAPFARLGRK
jgi:hypothetical protein